MSSRLETPDNDWALAVEGLTISIATRQRLIAPVRDVSFRVRRGGRLGVVGESGSGKSLTTLAIMGLLPQSATIRAGAIWYQGQDLLSLSEPQWRSVRGREISLVFQNALSALNPLVRVGDQIADVVQAHHRVSRRESWEQAVAILQQMGIPDPAGRALAYPHQYSGGMAQRAMIGLALVANPKVVLADEPTTGLDPLIEAQVLELLRERTEAQGQTLILVSHDIRAVSRMSTDVVVLYAGEVMERGPSSDVLSRPGSPYTLALLQSSVLRIGDKFRFIPGSARQQTQDIAGCVFSGRCWLERSLANPLVCRTVRPPLRDLAPGQLARCHFEMPKEAWLAAPDDAGSRSELPVPKSAGDVPMISGSDVTRWYEVRQSPLRRIRVQALVGVSISVQQGEIVGIIGESGSGKSTLGRLVVGLEQPSAGTLLFGGVPVRSLKGRKRREYRRSLQLVFQNPYRSFNPMLTVGESLKEAARFASPPPLDLGRAVAKLFALVGLDDRYTTRYPREMSGGELQRAAIARALATVPRVVFLDEPTSALDASVRGQVINVLLRLREETDLALVLVTHELDVVRALAERVLVLFQGQVVEEGPALAVLSDPLHPYTRALIVGEGLDPTDSNVQHWVLKGSEEADAPESGCRYLRRCPFALEKCRTEQDLSDDGSSHHVRCWRAAEIRAAAQRDDLDALRTVQVESGSSHPT